MIDWLIHFNLAKADSYSILEHAHTDTYTEA